MDQAGSDQLKQRQIRAFQSIVDWLVWILAGLTVAITGIAAIPGASERFLGLIIAMLIFTTCSGLARQAIRQARLLSSLLLIVLPMLAIAIGMAFTFRNASYLIFMCTVIAMLSAGLVISARTTIWIALAGLLIFFPMAIAAEIGLFDQWYANPDALDDYITPVIGLGAMTFIGVLAFILNNVLLESLKEAEQRGVVAETARAEQAITLTQVQQQATDQARLLELVRDLETPVIPLLEGVLVLPVVGHLDTQRMTSLTTTLLEQVHQRHAHTVLVDLTGVTIIDTGTANHLIHMAQAVKLLGSRVILTGIKAEVAQTLITLGISLSHITTAASLQAGIRQVTDRTQSGSHERTEQLHDKL